MRSAAASASTRRIAVRVLKRMAMALLTGKMLKFPVLPIDAFLTNIY